jgi:hypothetical protein
MNNTDLMDLVRAADSVVVFRLVEDDAVSPYSEYTAAAEPRGYTAWLEAQVIALRNTPPNGVS